MIALHTYIVAPSLHLTLASSHAHQFTRYVQDGNKALSLICPTRQPRHVAEGAVNLAKSVITGVGMGVLSLLAMPVAGFRQGGISGLVAGSLAGMLYGAVFALIGLSNGAYQMARGAMETPNAVRAARTPSSRPPAGFRTSSGIRCPATT